MQRRCMIFGQSAEAPGSFPKAPAAVAVVFLPQGALAMLHLHPQYQLLSVPKPQQL